MDTIEITKGSDAVVKMTIRDENGDNKDLTNVTDIEFKIKGTSTTVSKSITGGGVSITNITKGKAEAVLDETDTGALKGGSNQDVTVIVTDSVTGTGVKHLQRILNVIDPDC